MLNCWQGVPILVSSILVCCHAMHSSNTMSSPSIKESPGSVIPYYRLEHDDDLDVLVNAIGNAKIVLLGESTHGTHEYYTWRTAITKRLIEGQGFNFIAVEGDWDDSYKINQFIRGPEHPRDDVVDVLKQYDRWPSSMWSNYEMIPFLQWLNAYNQSAKKTIGFYGLDLTAFGNGRSDKQP
jgi:erythromycin esterase